MKKEHCKCPLLGIKNKLAKIQQTQLLKQKVRWFWNKRVIHLFWPKHNKKREWMKFLKNAPNSSNSLILLFSGFFFDSRYPVYPWTNFLESFIKEYEDGNETCLKVYFSTFFQNPQRDLCDFVRYSVVIDCLTPKWVLRSPDSHRIH